ncbi:MAG TPA: c-type cytochrome [Kofleriaceae bacterium]|jgi:DNA-binding beta-propeller fold protein YncE
MTMRLALTLLASLSFPAFVADARAMPRRPGSFQPTFQLVGRPIGGATPATATAPFLSGARIAAAGDGALVIDADSGALVLTDKAGKSIAQLAIGREAGFLAYDPTAGRAYVADRRGDRIAVVAVDLAAHSLALATQLPTATEPFGVALAPDRKTLLVTTIADRTLTAYDIATGVARWSTPLGREPRGVAIAPDGTRALVGYLATGTVDQIDLVETHRAEHIALPAGTDCLRCTTTPTASFARATFQLAFMGAHQAVVPFQRETPVQQSDGGERSGSYGGGFESPVQQQLAFVGFGKHGGTQLASALMSQNQPRAIAWDAAHDALYVAGMGTNSLLQIKDASQLSINQGETLAIGEGCGPDGLAIAPDGNVLVWCSFSRTVVHVDAVGSDGKLSPFAIKAGPEVVASALSTQQHQGMVLFHSAEPRISQSGFLACATCHPDGRTDGLSWQIEKHPLQTPLLAGRVTDTGPFKWDGTDATLMDSMKSTMKRLGGIGLEKPDAEALGAYLTQLPSVRSPHRDLAAVARGEKLFDAEGCRTCHDGKSFTDQQRHAFAGTLPQSDTPSLRGLAASAPYYHDGSAATIEALLRDRGAVHGMAETSSMTDAQVGDLAAFLETL